MDFPKEIGNYYLVGGRDVEAVGSNPTQPIVLLSQIANNQKERKEEWDIYNTGRSFRRQRSYISDWDTSKENKEKIFWFLRRTEMEGVGIVQRLKYIYGFKSFLKAVNKNFADVTEQDIEGFLYSLRNYKTSTKASRWQTMQKFFKYIKKLEIYDNIHPRLKRKPKLPEELLTQEDVKLMIKHARGTRDKALVSVLYESGCRIGEILSRKLKHISFDRLGAAILVDGKTGMRRIRLVNSVPLIANWIANHPNNEDPNDFLWINRHNSRDPIKYRVVYKILEQCASRARIRKKIHPHLFRHSRATFLAKHLTEQELKVYFGWVGDSRMVATYIHLSGMDIENKILELHGLKEENREEDSLEPIKCPRCRQKNSPESKFCNSCGSVLTLEHAMNVNMLLQNILSKAPELLNKTNEEILEEHKKLNAIEHNSKTIP